MKTLESYSEFAKNLFVEEETFQAKSKKTGKTVNYKSKEARDAAIKAGEAEKLDTGSDDDKGGQSEPTGKLGAGDFERDLDDDDPTRGNPDDSWDDEEGRAKPEFDIDDIEDDEEAMRQAMKDMEDEFDVEEESIKIINGKKYKAIK